MKKILIIGGVILLSFLVWSEVFALTPPLSGQQGGTGYATTIVGNIGKFLQVQSINPLIYTFGLGGSPSATTTINGVSGPDFIFATSTSGDDFNISFTVPGTVSFNLPDAGETTRGVISTGIQSFAGPKTFLSNLTIGGPATSTITGDGSDSTIGGNLTISGAGTNALNFLSSGASINWAGGTGLDSISPTGGLEFTSPVGYEVLSMSAVDSAGTSVDDISLLTGFRTYTRPDISGVLVVGTSTINSIAKWTDLSTLGSATAGIDYQNPYWILNGTNLYASSTSWKVGIGTTTPTTGLDIPTSFSQLTLGYTAKAGSIVFRRGTDGLVAATVGWNGANEGSVFLINSTTGSGETRIAQNSSGTGFVTIYTSSTERIRIAGNGRLGIGTTAPDYPLTDNGSIGFMKSSVSASNSLYNIGVSGANGLQIQDRNLGGNSLLYILNSTSSIVSQLTFNTGNSFFNAFGGNVGIATTTPQSLLSLEIPFNSTTQYFQMDITTTTPPSADCDSNSEAGRSVYVSSTVFRLFACRGASGWASSTLTF